MVGDMRQTQGEDASTSIGALQTQAQDDTKNGGTGATSAAVEATPDIHKHTPNTSSTITAITVGSLLVLVTLFVLCIDVLDYDQIPFKYTSNFYTDTTNSSSTLNSPSDHDSLIPLQFTDFLGFFFAALGLVLAAGGGIGGGGILVPVYILILDFLPKHAIPLSNVTVFGGAVANTIFNVRKRHPLADRPLIDWDLILVMEPSTLLGALVGANLNKILSETLIAVMLVVLLSFTAYGTLKKAGKMYDKETEDLKNEWSYSDGLREHLVNDYSHMDDEEGRKGANDNNKEDTVTEYEEFGMHEANSLDRRSLGAVQIDGTEGERQTNEEGEEDGNEDDNNSYPEFGNPLLLDHIIEQERQPKTQSVALIVVMFVVVLAINILKGGGGFASPVGIKCGSAAFWISQALLLVWIIGISLVARRQLIKDTALKMGAGFRYLKEDMIWDDKSTIIYPLFSTVAGFCAGMFGIGGGIVKGPLMIMMGVHPAVASATSACMILFTSFTATTTFAVYGLLVHDYAIACVILGFVATAVGQTITTRLLKKSRRNSYIAFSIGFVVLLSALLMTLQSVMHLMSNKDDDEFSGICSSHLNDDPN